MKNLLVSALALMFVACNAIPYQPYDESALTSPIKTITTTNREGGFFLVDYVDPKTRQVVYDFMLSDITGRGLIGKYGLTNPREEIKTNLVERIASTLKLNVVNSDKRISASTSNEMLSKIPETYSNGDLILDIATKSWSLNYKSGQYELNVEAESRLFEQATGKLVAYNACKPSGDQSEKYTESQWLENNAALLKKEMSKLSEICAKQLHEAIFATAKQ